MSDLDELWRIADTLAETEGEGPRLPLPKTWVPGDRCPRTGKECERGDRCWSDEECALYPTVTSELAAEAGAILARWAADAGAEGMCSGCAFRAGTRANRTDDVIIQVVGTAMVNGESFWCHDGVEHGERPTEMCRGWAAVAGMLSRERPEGPEP